jgi:hypothetical protein
MQHSFSCFGNADDNASFDFINNADYDTMVYGVKSKHLCKFNSMVKKFMVSRIVWKLGKIVLLVV